MQDYKCSMPFYGNIIAALQQQRYIFYFAAGIVLGSI